MYITKPRMLRANMSVRFSKKISPSFFLPFISFLELSVADYINLILIFTEL